MKRSEILYAKGDEVLFQNLKQHLPSHEFRIHTLPDGKDLVQFIKSKEFNLLIIGSISSNINDKLDTVKKIRAHTSKIPIIFITLHSSEAKAIAAFRAGVSDYLKKPFPYEELLGSIRRHTLGPLGLVSKKYLAALSESRDDKTIIGESSPIRNLKNYLSKVASTDSNVLITGETGTGKELAAELIHRKSSRYNNPFICVNCAALPENLVESELFGYDRGAFTGAFYTKPGKFAIAAEGSIFLDEIGDMTPFAQAKILRSIESKAIYPLGGKHSIPLNVRVIAATNQDPESLMEEGKFRPDLFYRLNVARVDIPPLRKRKGDIPLLTNYFIKNLNLRFNRKVKGLTPEAMDYLYRYHFPGNVRELMNLMEAIYINLPSHPLQFIRIPETIKKQINIAKHSTKNERGAIVSTLMDTKWNKSEAAQKLNWSRMTLYRKIKKYHIVKNRSPRLK